LPRAELDRIAKEVVGSDNRMGFVGEVFKAKDVNVRMYINQDGQEIFRFTSPAVFKSRTGEVVEHTLVRDAKTGAFDANSPEGLRLIEAMVEGSERGVVVIFQDLNYLGKTNYYHNGQAAGDKYLEAFGTSTREHLRPTDLTFKTGGDELVTILPITDEAMAQPEVVRTLTQRMSDSVSKSKQARAVFKEQSRVLSEEFKSVKLAAKFEDIPDAIASKLTPDQVKQAASNFVAFKESFLKNQIELLQSHAKFQPSISIGAAIVPKGSGTYAQAKVAAEGRAGQVKINYKKDAGTADEATLLKYGVTADDASNSAANFRRVEDIRPRALDPVILKAPPSANH